MDKKELKKEVGNLGESLAVSHLQKKGYEIVTKNFRHGHGEIDIIAKNGNTLVFVEVKAKKFGNFGDPITWVTRSKQRQIGKIAQAYLVKHGISHLDYRFDVITTTYENGLWKVNHIENAFWL